MRLLAMIPTLNPLPSKSLMSIRLLIVDDHETVRAGLRVAFAGTEIEVRGEATTVSTALALVSQQELDVVLLDLQLGDEDGFDVLRELRVIKPDLPVLIYSMHSDAMRIKRGQALGANGHVTKDGDVDTLVRGIQQVLRGEDCWESYSRE